MDGLGFMLGGNGLGPFTCLDAGGPRAEFPGQPMHPTRQWYLFNPGAPLLP
jgi:hypothetical protein